MTVVAGYPVVAAAMGAFVDMDEVAVDTGKP